MFEDSLLESGGKLKDKRGRYTTVAFLIEAVILGIALLIPLYYTETLPAAQLITFLVAPPPPPPPPPAAALVKIQKVVKVETDLDNGKLRTPSRIPKTIQKIVEDTPPPVVNTQAGVIGGVPGGVPGGQLNGVIGGIISSTPTTVPTLAPPPKVVRVSSGVSAGMLIRRIQPNYPPLARQARVQGSVLLEATISENGDIVDLHVVSGHPMLVAAAVEAVKQWRYRPYLLNGQPVSVQTQVQVNFRLDSAN